MPYLMLFVLLLFSLAGFAHPKLSGLVEVEMASGNSNRDNSLATVEVAIDTIVNKITRAHVQFLYEEGQTDFELDEGTIRLGTKKKPLFLEAGQKYLSFGSFESNMVSDPLTLEIGEFRETAFELTYKFGNYALTFLAFNGDINTNTAQSEDIDQFGATFDFSFGAGKSLSLEGKLSYINSLEDSDGISGAIPPNVDSHIAGIGLYTLAVWKNIALSIEGIQAMETLSELDFLGSAAKPAATNYELSYRLKILNSEVSLAVSNQQTREALALGLPETRNGIGASFSIFENTRCGLEYIQDTAYDGVSSNLFTIQLATQF